jgi:hypothetical protein
VTVKRIDNLNECFDFIFVSFVAKHLLEYYLEIHYIMKNSLKDCYIVLFISILVYFKMLFAGHFIKRCDDFLPSKFPFKIFLNSILKRKMVGVIIIFVCDHFQGVLHLYCLTSYAVMLTHPL